jgi:ABC-type Zn uptake system ZnuABC Zn-binding protein ZnuA
MFKRLWLARSILLVLCSVLISCGPNSAPSDEKLTVVATTTLIGDVAAQVGGEFIDLTVLMPVGVDPHSFEPAPGDMSRVADTDLVLVNGAGFEAFLGKLIENAGDENKVISVSEGIELLALAGEEEHDEHAEEDEQTHEHGEFDPHVWQDPNNVIIWVHNITVALSERDPDHADTYRANGEAYIVELQALDTSIQEQVAQIPAENRQFVTEHGTMNYFAARYGFEVVGAVIPAFSTLAEPSAQELADLENTIRDLEVKAILVGNTVSPALASQVAQDTGIELVPIFTDSLSEPEGDAPTYLDFMLYNVQAIVRALK